MLVPRHTRGRGLELALRVDQEVAGDDDAFSRSEPLCDLDAISEPFSNLDLPRLQVAIAAVDEDRLLQPGVEDGLDGNGHPSWHGDVELDVDKHVGLQDHLRVVGFDADL